MGGALVDEFPGAGGDARLVAGVTAVSARGAQWRDEAGFADGAEEALGGAEHLGGPAHGVGGVVVVTEPTAHPDTIEVEVHDPSRHVPRMLTPDPNHGTEGFGRPMVTGLTHATAPTRRASGSETVSALLAR